MTGPVLPFIPSPLRLKLEFSRAADGNRIRRSLYSPSARAGISGSARVITRDPATMEDAMKYRRFAFLSMKHDPNNVVAATGAFHSDKQFTEIGASMVALKGFNAGTLIVAALGLKEFTEHKRRKQYAAIQSDNIASRAIYERNLGWQKVDKESAAKIYEVVGRKPPARGEKSWFKSDAANQAVVARALLNFIAAGGLYNKATSQFIPVDFSALDEIGLPEDRILEIAETPDSAATVPEQPDINWRAAKRIYAVHEL